MGEFSQLLQSSDVTLSLYATSWISLLGFGALAILVACYMINLGYRETRVERLTIQLLFLIACAQLGCDCSAAMRSLIKRLNNLQDDLVSPDEVPEATLSPLLGMLMIGCCHVFATGRILSFASSAQSSSPLILRTVQAVVCVCVLICEITGITSISLFLSTLIFITPEEASTASIKPTYILSSLYGCFCCLIDIFLAALVIWQAREAKSRINTSAYRAIRSLKRITVTSSCITCVGQIFKIVCLFTPTLAIWSGIIFNAISHVYAISLLLSVSLPRLTGNIQRERTHRPTDSDYVHSEEVGSISGRRKSSSPRALSVNTSSKDEESSMGREDIDVEAAMGLSEMLQGEEKIRPTPGSPSLSIIRYQGGRLSDRKPSGEMESVREEDHDVVTPSRRRGSTATTLNAPNMTQDENGFDMSYIVSGLEVLGVEKV